MAGNADKLLIGSLKEKEKNQRKETEGDDISLSQILPPPLRTFNLFKLSWLTTFRNLCLSSDEVKCIWIPYDTQYMWENDLLFFPSVCF